MAYKESDRSSFRSEVVSEDAQQIDEEGDVEEHRNSYQVLPVHVASGSKTERRDAQREERECNEYGKHLFCVGDEAKKENPQTHSKPTIGKTREKANHREPVLA